ncbi:MAG: hypothetical protein E7283_08810 [Lachnospiraceae bacterium]|nr:hypothetical protein [Lachnospiraceae bacterium]
MEQEVQKTYKMKWFKFIIYVQLFLGAALMVVQGIPYITGTVYGEMSEVVYAMWGQSLRICDVLYGVANIIFAIAAIVVRMRLAKFKKNGPLCYLIYFGAQGVVGVIYMLTTAIIIGDFPITSIPSFVGMIVGTGIAIAVNYTYFDNRKELFIN